MLRISWSLVLLILACSGTYAQNYILTGQVTDQNGEALAGVSVAIIGGTGTATDGNGFYEFRLPQVGTFTENSDPRTRSSGSSSGTETSLEGLIFSYLGHKDLGIVMDFKPNAENGNRPAEVQISSPLPRQMADSRQLQFVRQEGQDLFYELDVVLQTKAYELDPLTITSTRADKLTPVTYVELEAKDIQERNLGQDVPYLLKWTPSVVVNSDAGTGIGYTGIWIRGTDPTRINVTLNGIPLNDSESQGVFWVNIPDFASSADNIQIQRGVGTSANGAGAFGATIDIATNQVKENAYASVDAGLGSFNTRRVSGRFGTGLLPGGFTLDGRLSSIRSDGFIDRGSADLDAWYLAGGWVGDRSVLRFNAFGGHEVTYQAWNGVPRSELEAGNRTFNTAGTERPGSPHPDEVDNYRQNHYQLHYSTELSEEWTLKLSGHYTKGGGYFEQYRAGEDLADYGLDGVVVGDSTITESDLIRRRWLDNDFYGLVYSIGYKPVGSRLDFTLGGAANRYLNNHFGEVIWARFASNSETDTRYYDNDAEKIDINVYGRMNYGFSSQLNGYLDLQVRQINYEFLGLDNQLNRLDQQVDYTFFNPKAGMVYSPDAGSRAYLSVGVAHREPSRNDHVDNPINEIPRPERLINTELGYERTSRRSNWGINFYHMAYQDQLVLTGRLNDVGEYIRANVPNSYRLGVELMGGVQLTDRLTLGGNMTLSRNRVRSYTEFLDQYEGEDFDYVGQTTVERENQPLAFSPDIQAAAELMYRIPFQVEESFFEAALQTKYIGRRYLDNSGDEANSLDPYTFTDLRLSLNFPAGPAKLMRLTFLARNLFDAEYISNGWSYRYQFEGAETLDQGFYPQAGRNFLVSLGLDF
ncbi:MAG: TonB-dependent receptor [Bacteroidota bacterium]